MRKVLLLILYWVIGITALTLSYFELTVQGHSGELPYGWIISFISFPVSLIAKLFISYAGPIIWPQGLPSYQNYLIYGLILTIGHIQWLYLGKYLKSRWDEHKM